MADDLDRLIYEADPRRARTELVLTSLELEPWRVTQRTALCEIPWQFDPDGPVHPCTNMATLDAQGRHVCQAHWVKLWLCRGCGTRMPEGNGGYCSQACTPEDEDMP